MVFHQGAAPSGTITAALPPGLSSCRNNAMNSSSVFFVFTTRCSLPLVLS
jgi:hypothetical protein